MQPRAFFGNFIELIRQKKINNFEMCWVEADLFVGWERGSAVKPDVIRDKRFTAAVHITLAY